MQFNLTKDIVFFDIEATGLNVIKDRILQIALIKYEPSNPDAKELTLLIDPVIPIAEEAIAVHGYTNEMLVGKPKFEEVAKEIFDFIGDADLAGYNSDRFDIPMLLEELNRAGFALDLGIRKSIDVQKIFYKMEPRTLAAAYRFYCKKEIENAHDALADVRATIDVLKGQLSHYADVPYIDGDGYKHEPPIKNDMQAIAEFIGDSRSIDATQRLKYNKDGAIVFNFGKYMGQVVKEVIARDKQYYNWIMDKDFSVQVKNTMKKIMHENGTHNS